MSWSIKKSLSSPKNFGKTAGATAILGPVFGAGMLAKTQHEEKKTETNSGVENLGSESSGPTPEEMLQTIMNQYLPQYAALNRTAISQDRTAGVDDIARLAPRLQGIREAGTRSDIRAMRDQLYASVLGDLSMGEALTPEQDRNAVQSVRSAQAARGMGGESAANIEAVRRALSGQALGQQRRAAASSVLASEAAQSPDPFSIITGLPTTASATAANQAGAGATTLTPSTLSQTFFGANSANQAANQYDLALQIAKLNPYLTK